MIRRLIILLLIVGISICGDYVLPYSYSLNFNLAPDNHFGISVESKGVLSSLAKDENLKDVLMILRLGSSDNTKGYEDYTETMGSVNFHNDREDGDVSTSFYWGLGLGRTISFEKNKSGVMIGGGFVQNSITYYQSLYDSYEILGNNGKYYIDGKTSGKSAMGGFLEILFLNHTNGFNWCFGFNLNSHKEFPIELNIGFFN